MDDITDKAKMVKWGSRLQKEWAEDGKV